MQVLQRLVSLAMFYSVARHSDWRNSEMSETSCLLLECAFFCLGIQRRWLVTF